MNEPAYVKNRKAATRRRITDAIIELFLPDYIDIQSLEDLETYVDSNTDEYGEYGAFCDYFGLGRGFEDLMAQCDFSIAKFYKEYREEIDRRAE